MREELKQRSAKYQLDATKDNQISVQECKQKLRKAYIAAQEQVLDSQVREQEGHSSQGRHAKSWAMINTITGKTPSFTGKIKGNSHVPLEWQAQSMISHFTVVRHDNIGQQVFRRGRPRTIYISLPQFTYKKALIP